MTVDQLTQFFGWCTVINFGLLIVTSIALSLFRGMITSIHSRMMGVPESELASLYFRYLASYKIANFVFSLVPYIALKIMG